MGIFTLCSHTIAWVSLFLMGIFTLCSHTIACVSLFLMGILPCAPFVFPLGGGFRFLFDGPYDLMTVTQHTRNMTCEVRLDIHNVSFNI